MPAGAPQKALTRHEPMTDCEVLVVGGGPAGLTAAIYLARFRRHVVLADNGRSRARYIPVSHNCPGFSGGISGSDLLRAMGDQAAAHEVERLNEEVVDLERSDDGFVARIGHARVAARRVLLATGLVDVLPDVAGAEQAVCAGKLRLCAICDAYETAGRKIAVLAPSARLSSSARFVRSFCADVTAVSTERSVDGRTIAMLRELGMPCYAEGRVLRILENGVEVQCSADVTLRFDAVYPELGSRPRSDLGRRLGAHCDPEGYLRVDDRLETTVAGLYAIGDVVHSLHQVAVGTGHAAQAASAIHQGLAFRPLSHS